MNKGMESKFNLIFLEHPLDAGKESVLGDNNLSYLL